MVPVPNFLSLSMAKSIPKIASAADIISALSCSPSLREECDSTSSANAKSWALINSHSLHIRKGRVAVSSRALRGMSKDAVQLLGYGLSGCVVPATQENPCAVVSVSI